MLYFETTERPGRWPHSKGHDHMHYSHGWRGSPQEWNALVAKAKSLNPHMSVNTLRTFTTVQLRELVTGEKAGFRANRANGDFLIRIVDNAWDESKHPRDDDGKWTDAGGGGGSRGGSSGSLWNRWFGSRDHDDNNELVSDARSTSYGAKGSLIGGAAGILAGAAVVATMAAAPGTSKLVRVLKKLTGTRSIRPGEWSPKQIAFSGAGIGASGGALLGGGYGAIKGNAEASPIDDLRALLQALQDGDEEALVAGLREFDQKWGNDGQVVTLLDEIEAEASKQGNAEPGSEAEDDVPDHDTAEELKSMTSRSNSMHSLDEAVRDRLPNITASQLRTFSPQQKQEIVAGMSPRGRVFDAVGLWANGTRHIFPVSKAEAEAAAADLGLGNGGSFVRVNQAVADGTRIARMRRNALDDRGYSEVAPPSSFVANARIVAAKGRR